MGRCRPRFMLAQRMCDNGHEDHPDRKARQSIDRLILQHSRFNPGVGTAVRQLKRPSSMRQRAPLPGVADKMWNHGRNGASTYALPVSADKVDERTTSRDRTKAGCPT